MIPEKDFAVKQIVLILLGSSAGPVLASELAALRFPHVLLDEKPPQSRWFKIVGDLNADGRPDLLGANHGGSYQPVELWRNGGR